MFATACVSNREAIYGMLATSALQPKGLTASNGSAFMVAPGFLITAAHCVHVNTQFNQPVHNKFELIRATDIGQKMERGTLVAFDDKNDLALLKIDAPRSTTCLKLLKTQVPTGTPCGSLGFPLAGVSFTPQGIGFNLTERFQGANISAYINVTDPKGNRVNHYETDSLMYKGSSGCPGFIASGEVFGMHNRSAVEGQTSSQGASNLTRLAISMWVPSLVIVTFAAANGVVL